MGDTITQIGRYEISRQLVDTALASVYAAFDPVERKPVAIRVPRTTHHGSREVALGLRHPGLMTVLSYEQSRGEAFLVLEPFQGTPLDTILESSLESGRNMEPAEVLGLLRQLASALDFAHSHGSLHGSLHPASILLNDRKEIKVLDLGAPAAAGNASPERLLRAIHYLSPECVRDQPMDGRSDQFSLAVLAHRMLTGELPFAGKPLGVMFRIAYQGFERDAIREFPAAAQTVLDRALAKSPGERYGTCGEMVEALAGALLRSAPSATRMANATEVAALPSLDPAIGRAVPQRRFPAEAVKYFAVTFVVCALALAGVLYVLLPKRPQAAPVAPASVGQPVTAPPAKQPAAQTPAPLPRNEAKTPPKNHTKKKAEPDVDLKPAEPKIIRQ
jgi:serine/threonine-protein kinase